MQGSQTETIEPRSSDDPVLREIVRRLAGAYNPKRITSLDDNHNIMLPTLGTSVKMCVSR
jgi:hypothetical protein